MFSDRCFVCNRVRLATVRLAVGAVNWRNSLPVCLRE
jgi:hypothetical protein